MIGYPDKFRNYDALKIERAAYAANVMRAKEVELRRQLDWWTPSVSAEFDRRAACVVDQFNGYVAVDDVHVNGKLTNGENIADLGGLKLALTSAHAKAPSTPEADREFFAAFGQAWCEQMRPETMRVLVQTDPHSPSQWRVNGPQSNMPEFAAAFSFQAGDAMVRPAETQCTVW